MLLHVQYDIQISGGPTGLAHLTCAGKADAGSILHARRHLGVDRALAQYSAFALAFRAGIGDDAAATLACRTGARDTEKSLLIPHLAAPVARSASRGTFPRSRTGTVAIFASLMTSNRDTGLSAEKGFLELQRQIFPQIRAALH